MVNGTIFNSLAVLAEQQGFLTYDNINDAINQCELPINEVDLLVNSLLSHGILIYNKIPQKINKGDSDFNDFAHCDYETIFNRVVKIEPSLLLFIEEVRKTKPPQRREFEKIIHQAKEGNGYARNRIIEMYLRIAVRLGLQKSEQFNINLVDCIEIACEGLIIALDKYNPDKNGSFGSYASFYIWQNLSREMETQRPDVVYPMYLKELYLKIFPDLKNKGCDICEDNWRCKTIRFFIKNKINCSNKIIEDIIRQVIPFESLDKILEGNDIKSNLPNYLYEQLSYYDDIDSVIEQKDLRFAIETTLNTIPPREKEIIELLYGLSDYKEKTLDEVGYIFNISRQRVQQIEAKALRRLRHPLRSNLLKKYMERF